MVGVALLACTNAVPVCGQVVPGDGIEVVPALEPSPGVTRDSGIEFVPYLWAPTIAGDVGLGAIEVPVRLAPASLVNGVKAGAMGYARLEHGNHFAYGEIIAVDFGDPAFSPFFGQPVQASVLFTEVGSGLDRVIRIGGTTVKLSPYAGFQHLTVGARVSGALATRAAGAWSSPVAGMIAQVAVAPRLGFDAKLDAAGFGAGGVDYRSASAAVEYRVSRHIGVAAGYRSTRGRYAGGTGLSLDLKGSGPLIAVRYRP